VHVTSESYSYGKGSTPPVLAVAETDPRGIVNHTVQDMLGRTVQTIAASTGDASSIGSDQTTTYTYNGIDEPLTVQAIVPVTVRVR
jgi:hypothetical protein